MKTWQSDCLIEGFKQKLKGWDNVELKLFFCIDGKPWRSPSHVARQERRLRQALHTQGLEGRHSDFFFRGHHEALSISQLNAWCQKKGKLNLTVTKL